MILADADLQSIQEARDLVRRSRKAADGMKRLSQEQVDRICAAMAEAGAAASKKLAEMAVAETGFGNPVGKFQKNRFATEMLWESLRDLKTVGVVHRDDERRYYQVAEPYGVVIAIVPTTNPTSTAMYKSIISLKARNTCVISPHPRAKGCIAEAARIMNEAAIAAGAPDDVVLCHSSPTLEATQEMMHARESAVILATGGPGLVRSAYSAGKPAYGVGPGNAPAFIERTADIHHAVRAIVGSQMFDNATICASEQSVVVDSPIWDEVVAEFTRNGAHWCTPEERSKLETLVVRGRRVNADIVGLFPHQIAAMAGFTVPETTTVLLTVESGVGWDHPLSVEKLSPILSVYREEGWEAGCDRCIEILNFGGRGHTLAIHSQDENVIWTFVYEKPTHRVLINAPSAQGAVGFGSGLVPSLTLGCGAFGGNITSDNISAHNLVLTKHVGYVYEGFVESFPDFGQGPPSEFVFNAQPAAPAPGVRAASGSGAVGATGAAGLPKAPAPSHPVWQGNPSHPSNPHAPSASAAQPARPTGARPPYEGGEIPKPRSFSSPSRPL